MFTGRPTMLFTSRTRTRKPRTTLLLGRLSLQGHANARILRSPNVEPPACSTRRIAHDCLSSRWSHRTNRRLNSRTRSTTLPVQQAYSPGQRRRITSREICRPRKAQRIRFVLFPSAHLHNSLYNTAHIHIGLTGQTDDRTHVLRKSCTVRRRLGTPPGTRDPSELPYRKQSPHTID